MLAGGEERKLQQLVLQACQVSQDSMPGAHVAQIPQTRAAQSAKEKRTGRPITYSCAAAPCKDCCATGNHLTVDSRQHLFNSCLSTSHSLKRDAAQPCQVAFNGVRCKKHCFLDAHPHTVVGGRACCMVAVAVAVLVLLTMMRSFAANTMTLLHCHVGFMAIYNAPDA